MSTTASVLSIWAHYDDDLIFGSPTIAEAVAAGAPVTTVFLTGSDAGRDADYVAGREHGLRLAYAAMRGRELAWTDVSTSVEGARLTGWQAVGAPITLLTLGLPDGRPNGAGFESTGGVSLRKLLEGGIERIAPLGSAPAIDAAGLTALLAGLLAAHADARVLTHAAASQGEWATGDHSDHWSTGEFVRRAGDGARVSWRVGYPSARLPATLVGDALAHKVEVFRAYAAHDPVVARDRVDQTLALRGFGEWLQREYELVDGAPRAV